MNSQKLFDLIRSITWPIWGLILLAFLAGVLISGGNAPEHNLTPVDIHHKATEWTCSMHPQVRLPEPGQCPICFMDLIPLEETSGGIGIDQLRLSAAASALAEISTSVVKRASAFREIRLSGKLDYDETRIKRISAWIPGRLDKMYVDFSGTTVRKGEHLFEIYSPELLAAQEELIQANDQLKRLRTDDALGRRTFEATLKAAREKLTLLGMNSDQIAGIETRGKASRTLTVHSPISGIVLEKDALEGSYVKTGTPVYTIADLEHLWLVLDAYESDLAWLNQGQEIIFQAEALPGKDFKGRISFIHPVLNEKTRTVRVRANIPNAGGVLKPGMFVRAMVKASLNASGEVLSTELAGKWVCPMHPEEIRDRSGTCQVCGMPLVRAETLGLVKGKVDAELPLLVPVTSVLLTGPRAIVYVKISDRDESQYELREVVLGPRAGDHYVVLKGLQEGEEVVTHGSFKIDSAMQIAAKPSMMNPNGGHAGSGHSHEGSMAMEPADKSPVMKVHISSQSLSQLDRVYTSYFKFQDALASDDMRGSRAAAKDLAQVIQELSFPASEGEVVQEVWEASQMDIQKALEHREHWGNLGNARRSFEDISRVMIRLERQFGHGGVGDAYELFCPMAFDNKGATWLQAEETVNNPYFGASMLRCGEVREQFKARVD